MQPSIIQKLIILRQRYQHLATLLSSAEVISDQNRYRELAKEYSSLGEIVEVFSQYELNQQRQEESHSILKDKSADDLHELATDELVQLQHEAAKLEKQLQLLMLPSDVNDACNVFLEVRAGAGGDEAAIFAGDLFRMYAYYAEREGWQLEVVSSSVGEHGGYREIIARIVGKGVYARLKFESGVHRVQRVPATEAQGRIHTSTCTVAVIAEADEIDEIELNPADLKVDTYRSSGAGGQHVNVTDSAIRITHIPTGTVVECQDERSQHKNRARALSLLKAKLLAAEQEKQRQEEAATRKSLVGTGDRSERIRTYNFPQGRLTDHRINLTIYQLERIMEGELTPIIDSLIQQHKADQLANFAERA